MLTNAVLYPESTSFAWRIMSEPHLKLWVPHKWLTKYAAFTCTSCRLYASNNVWKLLLMLEKRVSRYCEPTLMGWPSKPRLQGPLMAVEQSLAVSVLLKR